ncbi:MAG: hypothetical protein OHK0053_36580 [Microscillaceae bacterium]
MYLKQFSPILLTLGLLLGACQSDADKKKVPDGETASVDTTASPKGTDESSFDGKEVEADRLRAQYLATLQNYFDNLSQGDYEAAAQSFAEKVNLWITIENTKPAAIAKEAKRFLSSKKNVAYTLLSDTYVQHGNLARVQVRQQWAGYDTTVEIELLFDKAAKLISYYERKVLKKAGNPRVADLEAYLKKLTKEQLPFESYGEGDDMSDLGLKLFVDAEMVPLYKEGLMGRAIECFWYEIDGNVIGFVMQEGNRQMDCSLITINRKTGQIIDRASIGGVSYSMMMRGGTQYNFYKDRSIRSEMSLTSPEFDETTGEEKEVTTTTVEYYQVDKNGKISRKSKS